MFDSNEIWARNLYHSTTLNEGAKNIAPTSAKNGKKVAYHRFIYSVYGILAAATSLCKACNFIMKFSCD